MKSFAYDEIGYWSEIKLDIVRKYASAYSAIMSTQPAIKKHIYIDAFAGAGRHVSRRTGGFVPGSPLNALEVVPPCILLIYERYTKHSYQRCGRPIPPGS